MTASTADIAAWNEFLDELESGVTDANRVLESGDGFDGDLVQPWSPPQHLSRLPDELLQRAQQVSRAITELELRASAHRNELGEEIKRLRQNKVKAQAAAANYGDVNSPKFVDRSV